MSALLVRLFDALFEPHSAGDALDHPHWRHDPLAHPALSRLSQAQLGDIPWSRAVICPVDRREAACG